MSPISRPYSGHPIGSDTQITGWSEPSLIVAVRTALRFIADDQADGDSGHGRDELVDALAAAGVLRQLGELVEAYALRAARAGEPAPLSWDQIARASGYPKRSTGQRRYDAAAAIIAREEERST